MWEFMSQIFTKKREDEDFEKFIKTLSERRNCWRYVNAEVDEQIAAVKGHWQKLTTQEEKCKFLEECWAREAERSGPRHEGRPVFKKATDDQLRNASKFIAATNLSKLATRYLGFASQNILGRDAFDVLKLWRDAMPGQGSKEVCIEHVMHKIVSKVTMMDKKSLYNVWHMKGVMLRKCLMFRKSVEFGICSQYMKSS